MPHLYMGRLTDDVRERDIEDFLRGYGRIRDIVMKRGFAFIDMEDERDAEDAVHDLHGQQLCGDRVILEFSKGGSASRRGGWGRSRGSYYDRYPGPPYRGSRFDHDPPSWVEKYGPIVRTRHRIVVENLSTRLSWQ